jgi:YHS domain-containing protein
MKKIILAVFMFGLGNIAWSQTQNLDKNKVAVKMYDVVGYQSGYAIEGKKQFSSIHQGATYFFYSENNKKAFAANPEKYVPAYGGWCAYAMGVDGSFVEVDPTSYKVIAGKTYLFYKSLDKKLKKII